MRNLWKSSRCIIVVLIAVLLVQPAAGYPLSRTASAHATCGRACSRYDVVVIGSEIQGVLLAKEAHKLGLKVLILDPRSRPGGELLEGQMYCLDFTNDNKRRSLVQGEIKSLFDGYRHRKIRTDAEFRKYYMQEIKGLPLRSGINIESVDVAARTNRNAVRSLTYRARDGLSYKVEADYFVENTDFNALTGWLNVKRIPGMESIYHGMRPDYMAATLMLKFKNVDWRTLHETVIRQYPLKNVRRKYGQSTYVDWNYATGFSNLTYQYKPTDRQLTLRGINSTNQLNGQVIMNALLIFDVDPANPASVEEAVRKGKAEAPHILQFLRKHIPGFAHAQLNGFPDYLYIRDYNRFETDYILKHKDLMEGRMFWDNVSIGGYAIDLQATRRIPKGYGFGKPDRYGIPLRSFELKSYENVLVTGKNVGAEIKAYGSARIMPTTALAAQTIGIILGRERGHKSLTELTPDDFERIHEYLRNDYHIRL